MKKIIALTICAGAFLSANAQKEAVDQAKKLAGKIDKVEDARALLKQAKADPSTANEVQTYYIAGKVEFDAFDAATTKRSINPNDPAVNTLNMGTQLINGYNEFLKALPLDSVPNEKGQIKPKHSKEMIGRINAHHADYYNYGGEFYNNKKFYPEAYNAFLIYGDIASQPWADKAVKAVADTTLALSYYYAGIAAFSGNELEAAINALSKARKHGITDPQAYVYEIACWQNIALKDKENEDKAKVAIENVAMDGFNRFGIKNPLFINNLVNSMIQQEKLDDAVALVSTQIEKTPEEPFLYGLRAYVYDRKKDEKASLEDYRKAASFPNADVETLNGAARKLYNAGVKEWNEIEGNQPEKRQDVKVNYWEAAKALVERVEAADPGNPDAASILDNINYALETYF